MTLQLLTNEINIINNQHYNSLLSACYYIIDLLHLKLAKIMVVITLLISLVPFKTVRATFALVSGLIYTCFKPIMDLAWDLTEFWTWFSLGS